MTDQKKTRRQMLEEFVAKKPDDAFSRYGHFRALIERTPDYIPAYLMYGQMLARESRNEEAKHVLSDGMAAATKKHDDHARSEMETLFNELS
jgi:hypothetical protein